MAWVKVFSKMLSVIVPISVQHELVSNDMQKIRMDAYINGTPKSARPHDCPLGFFEPVMKKSLNPLHSIFAKTITDESKWTSKLKPHEQEAMHHKHLKQSQVVPMTADLVTSLHPIG